MANILNSTTPKNSFILDEIRRGASTYDGLGICASCLIFSSSCRMAVCSGSVTYRNTLFRPVGGLPAPSRAPPYPRMLYEPSLFSRCIAGLLGVSVRNAFCLPQFFFRVPVFVCAWFQFRQLAFQLGTDCVEYLLLACHIRCLRSCNLNSVYDIQVENSMVCFRCCLVDSLLNIHYPNLPSGQFQPL